MSKLTLLDSINVQTPCTESWNEMKGTNEIRFCSHCAKDVHNLSEMTRKRARQIVAKSNGGICVRYVKRPDGRIQTIKNQFHQITRQTGIAAGVLGTSLTFSTLAYAQATPENNPTEPVQTVEVQNATKDSPTGKVSGIITDQNGAAIPYALVTISNPQTNFYQTTNSTSEGFYEFKDVPTGNYQLKIDAGGFASKEIARISISEGNEETQNVQLSIENVQETVIVDVQENGRALMGITMGLILGPAVPRNELVLAVERNDIEEVKVRIAMGERVSTRDKSYGGSTPLHVAVENGNIEIAQILLNAGAKTNAKNFDKRTPLMMLDEDATPELVNLLLRYRAKVNVTDSEKNTPLILASAYSNAEVVQALINAGANVNATNKEGETALMSAVRNDEIETVKLLLGSGANVNSKTKEKESALSLAKKDEIRQFLVAYGAVE